jgi:hypothetical protein
MSGAGKTTLEGLRGFFAGGAPEKVVQQAAEALFPQMRRDVEAAVGAAVDRTLKDAARWEAKFKELEHITKKLEALASRQKEQIETLKGQLEEERESVATLNALLGADEGAGGGK